MAWPCSSQIQLPASPVEDANCQWDSMGNETSPHNGRRHKDTGGQKKKCNSICRPVVDMLKLVFIVSPHEVVKVGPLSDSLF